ncbi:MAG: NifU family protein, partial [Pseudomonadota bacterium]|nr:NifU family protein [Pseudomonadota bacterium]
MFIQTEATPNPATLKFMPGQAVMGAQPPADFPNAEAAKASPLASALFALEHVTGVFFGADFITVTKDDAEWQHIKPAILTTIMDHFVAGLPVMHAREVETAAQEDEAGSDAEIIGAIKQLLDTRVRPAVAQDGGDIVFHGYRDGVVSLHMRGACAGCPSATA